MCEPEIEESSFWEIAKNIWPVFRRYWVAVVFFFLGIILLFIPLIFNLFDRPNKQSIVIEHSASESANIKPRTIKVDVEGAVNNPGVYELNSNDRVEDAVRKAKGLASNADNNWIIKNLNLAQKLIDGAKIFIPSLGDSVLPPTSQTIQNFQTFTPSLINLNLASKSDLESLSGVGPATAQKIIEGRLYEKIEDLLTRKIVGKSVFEKIKEKISVY